MKNIVILLFGLGFGFILSRSGATDFDLITKMFLFEDLHLMGVIGVAIGVAGLGLFALRKMGVTAVGMDQLPIKHKPRHAGNFVGGLIFGTGWAITGTCPGTVLSQIGEGKLVALFTLAGILVGTQLYRIVGAQLLGALQRKRWAPKIEVPDAAPVVAESARAR